MRLAYPLMFLISEALCHTLTPLENVISDEGLVINSINFSTRAYWMRRANAALAELVSPCPFGAFGSAIVNHTGDGLGDLICIGANSISSTGNPTLHGMFMAIWS